MDERVVVSAIIGAVIGALLGFGAGAIVEYFTDAPGLVIGPFIGAGLVGFFGWVRES